MPKKTTHFVCQNCGAVYGRWAGQCSACGEWNTIVEEAVPTSDSPMATAGVNGHKIDFSDLRGAPEIIFRLKTGIGELDRVCGGGLVPGSVVLVGGDPGIGKSTLLLQAVSALTRGVNKQGSPTKCAYISGEESVDQVRLRALRLGLADNPVDLASETRIRDIVATLDVADCPDVVIIDSIQTMYSDMVESAPGTVAQVRACGHELIRLAKKRNFVLLLVGHVTKEGTLAGPRVLEHMVDTVLYFEGDRGHHFRILRSVKNRFGATDEIGVFEMTEKGLSEVQNPSALFLADRQGNVSGSCVFAGIEGSRPMLVEIQALVAPMAGTSPRRAVVGWDANRLNMLLAVLETRCGVCLSNKDIFLNVAGGLKLSEPAVDLAAVMAVLSGVFNHPLPSDMVIFGEIGLSGEIRNVPQSDLRLKEAEKLGFAKALIPQNKKKKSTFKATEIGNLKTLLEFFERK
ncbi:MAG: DNA repair protein RadA [Alphaproteobacteria bacterium]|nr:DNA repair protein RadA [Alphaproteobacteria bacterium]